VFYFQLLGCTIKLTSMILVRIILLFHSFFSFIPLFYFVMLLNALHRTIITSTCHYFWGHSQYIICSGYDKNLFYIILFCCICIKEFENSCKTAAYIDICLFCQLYRILTPEWKVNIVKIGNYRIQNVYGMNELFVS
jgi:hypothetical protein